MKIYRNSVEIHDIEIDKNTELRQSISGEDLITSRFTLPEKIDLQIGDYVTWNGIDYTLLDEPQYKKSQGFFSYALQFKSTQYLLKNVLVLLDDNAEFYLFGNAQTLVSQIINNLNRVYGGYYADFVEDTEEINFFFNNFNCLAAIQNIATQLACEFRVEGKKITFRKKLGQETGLTFQYHKELREIERKPVQNAELVTKLYPFGSTRNITNDYGNKRLKINPISNNVGVFGIIERVKVFEDIYPRFKGNVGSTSSITKFKDTGIDFNINDQLVPGLTAKVTFNSGDLAGREFEISSYNSSTKEVEIIPYSDDTGLTLPNDTLKPRVGDKYVFWDIKMPQTYIDNAEAELLEKSQEYLEVNSQPNVAYTVTPDYTELKNQNISLKLGDIITINDTDFGITFSVRILSLTQKIVNPFEYELTIGNQVTLNYVTQVINDQKDIRNEIYLNEIKQKELYDRLYYNLRHLKTAVYVNRNEFDSDTYYYNNENRRDYVFRYDNTGTKNWYYFIGDDHTKGAWIESNWQLIGDSFEIIASETILAENANIGDWIIQNGQLVSQAGYDNEPRAQLNGLDGILRLVSPVTVQTESGAVRTYKQVIEINSQTGEIIASRSGDSFQRSGTIIINADGMFANNPGTQAVSSSTGLDIKGAVVGHAQTKTSKSSGVDLIAGIIGIASNSSSNPAPSYGGAFWNLKTFGRSVNVKVITSSQTSYSINKNDEFISCYNSNTLKLYLPSSPYVGTKIIIKRLRAHVDVYGKIFFRNSTNRQAIADGDTLHLIWDGTYWCANKMTR